MKTREEVAIMITVAQDEFAGELKRKWAMNDLLADIMQYHMNYHLAKYIRKITVSGLDESDLRQTFMIGCADAIGKANISIGDPMMYIIKMGKNRVLDLLRHHYRKDLRQYCNACQKETRIHELAGVPTCPNCGAVGEKCVERIQHNALDDGTVLGTVVHDGLDLQQQVVSDMVVQTFRGRLVGRKLDVFDLIIMEGYDRDSCTNYIKEVAEKLGITSSNVNIRLKAIKEEWMRYMDEIAVTID